MKGSNFSRITFLPFEAQHLPLMASWLEAPHIREWWGEPEQELDSIRAMIEGRNTTRPFLIVLNGKPLGYIQVWSLGDHQTASWLADYPWLAAFPAEAVGIDLSIGEPEMLSCGLGSAALRLFVEKLAGEGRETIIIDPDPANKRAVRAYEKAGFRPVPGLAGRTEGIFIMQFHSEQAIPSS